jgi:hypothetical protein
MGSHSSDVGTELDDELAPCRRTKTRSAALRDEIDAIDHANRRYWRRGASATRAERAEYHLRQARLEMLRAELETISSVAAGKRGFLNSCGTKCGSRNES